MHFHAVYVSDYQSLRMTKISQVSPKAVLKVHRIPYVGSAGACERRKVIFSDLAAVALGILCVLLLAVIIVLFIKHNTELHQIQSHNDYRERERQLTEQV